MNKARICSQGTQPPRGDGRSMSNKMEVIKGSKGRFRGVQSRRGQGRFHKEVTFELDME